MNSPVTIVIPAYNRAETIGRTLDSIASQTLKPAGIILVDNNSADNTLEIMHDWATRHTDFFVKVLSEPKRGACAARNCGLKEVKSDFVMFFDSDDVMLPTHVADFSNAINSNPDIGIFGRDIIDTNFDGSTKIKYFKDRNPFFNHLFRVCLSTQRIVIRTDLIRKVGGWNEELPGWDDYELGVRLLLCDDNILDIGGKASVIRYSLQESLTGSDFSSHPERWEKSLDYIEKELREAGRNDLIKWVDCRRMILAARYAREANNSTDSKYRDNALMLSERLKEKVLSKSKTTLRLKLVFLHNYYFSRLTWLFCKFIF